MICKCETLNITEKNDEQILVTVMRGFEQKASENESEGTPQPFPVEISTDIDVKLTTPRAQRLPIDFTVGDEGRILIDLKPDRVKTGTTYGIEVTGVVNGSRWCAIGDSVIRITRTTERGPKQVKVDSDPYEVTLWAGYVGDVVPRHLRDLDGYAALTQLLDAMGETLGKKADAEDVTNALKNIIDRFKEYVPTSDKGKAGGVPTLGADGKVPIAQLLTEGNGGLVLRSLLGAINGVATLDGGRLVWDDQLRMGWRGYYTGDIDATNITPGIWGIDNRSLGAAILGDELAHGILVQFCDTQHRNYRTQLLLVGRNAQSPNGDALEIYARRYLPGKSGWGEWYSSAKTEYTLTKTGSNIELKKNGTVVGRVADANTTYSTMSQAEAEAGTATSARTMSAKILKAAIEKHTEDKPSTQIMNQAIQHAMESLDTSNLTEITHGELVLLRNAGGLVPGRNYRITDFVTITNSAGSTASIPFTSDLNPFDLIVTATSASTLSEDARVIQHEGNTYFKNCNLSAWQIKYSLDNDVQRFSWASTESGKGVIYWMRDEFGNEAPYDFKNILFKRKVNTTGHSSATGEDGWCFTFNYFDQLSPVQVVHNGHDIVEHNGHDMTVRAAGDDGIRCFGNKVQAFCNYSQKGQATHALPNIVLLNASGYQVPVCANNIFGVNCRTITLNPQSKDNVFGGECQQIELGAYARHNVIGNYCCYIAGGYALYYNNIGAGCWNIDIGEYARQLTFHSSVLYASTPAGTSSSYVKNCEVMGGSYGNSSEKGAIPFAAGADYPQVAYKAQDGSIKVADASSESAMPLTRVVDKYTTEGLLNPDNCTESGVYENVEFPGFFSDVSQGIEHLYGKPCSLFVSEISSDDNEESVQFFYRNVMHYGTAYYKTLIQVAFCDSCIAVRKYKFLVSCSNSNVIPPVSFHPWRSIPSFGLLDNYALKSDTLDRYKVGEEVRVGEWEENGVTYDLYRKVVSFGELPNAAQKTVAHGIADKVKFTRVTAMASNGFPIPFVTQDASKAIYIALGNNQITINTHATDRSALTADVTIEFTRAKPSTT